MKMISSETLLQATNFESVARIPLLIRAPWIKNPPARCDALVELVDIMPTIIELAGFENPPDETIDGVSVLPLMSSPSSAATKEYVFSQYPRIARHPDKLWESNNPIHNPRETFTHMGYSIRSKEYRYTEWLEWNKTTLLPIWDKLAGTELYDHRGIPTYPTDYNAYENKNHAGDQSYANVQKEFSAVLRKHFPSPADGPIEPPRCIPDGQCRTASTQYECCTGDHFSTLNCGIYGRCGCRLSGECAEKESDCCSGASHYTLACPGLQRCQGF